MTACRFSFVFMLTLLGQVLLAENQCIAQEHTAPHAPSVADPSNEATAALIGFQTAPDLAGSLFAAEPLVANPVAFSVSARGHVYVCESFRQSRGVTDNRDHPQDWVDADLAAETVEDRRAYHQRLLGADTDSYSEQDDRVRVLVDADGDGVADSSQVFADQFNDLIEGTGAGVLEHGGSVYYTCIPNLWRMRDNDGDLQADSREVLHSGYGVRVAYRGHDLHGLRHGPDGRLYFSIGDRGANVETPGGRVVNTESGSIFRCELDGSDLEIVATGLRNPQELAFDEYGNLFTGDNNSDSGDRARWVYVVEGGDSGWRMAYQYLRDRGPFNREKLWHPFHEEQAAYIVPPVANISDGPSGLDYYPGTGFSDDFRGRFFLVDFRGTPSQSGVRSFCVEPDGAFFKLVDDEQPIWGMLATDLQFGPDGYLYVSDWVNGWTGEGKGRIYRFVSSQHHRDPIVAEVQKLLADSFRETPVVSLVELLAHQDQRVRLNAQYELASRRESIELAAIAADHVNVLARLHAIWGLGQIARADEASTPLIRQRLLELLDDSDTEVRAHATRLLGEIGGQEVAAAIRDRLADDSPRVRYFAAQSVGKLGMYDALGNIVGLLAANDDHDPILRHGGIMALSRIASDEQLLGLSAHESVAVRIGAVVALRRQASPVIANFLSDESPRVVLEAARAIHDVPIPEAMPALAALISHRSEDDALMRRVLNANFRLGETAHAKVLADFAARDGATTDLRLEAIAMLGDWAKPGGRDRVLGMWRPLPERDARTAADVLRPIVGSMTDGDSTLRLEVARVAGDFGIAEAAPVLQSLVQDEAVRAEQRADALWALVKITGKENLETVQSAAKDESVVVRSAAVELLPGVDPLGALPLLEAAALEGEVLERQAAIAALGQLQSDGANAVLAQLMTQLIEEELAPEVHLETLTAARSDPNSTLQSLLDAYEARLDAAQPLDQFRETLFGGDRSHGREIFFERTSVSCVRCHKVFFRGGEVGPELSRIGAEKDRTYLLEALVDPNKAIAQGFESVMVIDDTGRVHVGVLKEETESHITLVTAEAALITIPKDAIDERHPSQSAMPADVVELLSKSEVRDLVEYLASLTGRWRFRGDGRFE